ncbi:hypothetical protein DY000_02034144 [Brassica cretica]|uniref:UAS domain-containing protein n=1 Tax=Brassica cretica TaxID=69181 RepID=A0ABQ7DS00_BRACR|nr:hypothetical protein DY000_02034144 [Brassica cretica]
MEEIHQKMISSFITKITSSSRDVARLFLEAHQWDIDAAVSDFNQVVAVAAARRNVPNPRDRDSRALPSNLGSRGSGYNPRANVTQILISCIFALYWSILWSDWRCLEALWSKRRWKLKLVRVQATTTRVEGTRDNSPTRTELKRGKQRGLKARGITHPRARS